MCPAEGPLRREALVVVWFGEPSRADEEWIEHVLREVFGFRISGGGRTHRLPPEAYVSWSDQWDPSVLLDHLVDEMDLDAVRVLGVVQEDLAGGRSPWSLGLGQPEGKAAVVSLHRLVKALERSLREGADPAEASSLYRRRLAKLVAHEMGHTFREWGRIHCPDRDCLMAPLEFGLADLDDVPPAFCESCRAEIATAVTGPVNTAVTYYNLGLYFEERGRADRAESAYRRALHLSPDFPRALNNLGALALRKGDLAEAEAALRRAVGEEAGYALAHLNLGRVLRKRGKAREALACFERCLALDAALTVAHRDGGALLLEDLKDPEAARTWFENFFRAGGRDDPIRRWLAERGADPGRGR
jgi:predicted Zn-dependent protease